MTIDEASKRFQIDIEKLKYYESNGLLECKKNENGVSDYQDADLQRVSLIHFLLDAGLDLEILKHFLKLLEHSAQTKDEQIRILKKQRFRLLDDLHCKQQSLDRLDYIIHEIKNQKIWN
jgi:DNA-binding transcriptional MerR regulator